MERRRMGERITALVSAASFPGHVLQQVVEYLWDAEDGEYVVVYGEAVRKIGGPQLVQMLNSPSVPSCLTVVAA
jgi:hypothetical protein